jgi:starvation-inducible DNA-binding protein
MQSAELLNKHLAAAIDLQALVRREYWNIRQPRFIAILELFYKISAEVKNHSDLIGVAS